MQRALLLAVVLAGCQAPSVSVGCIPSFVLREDLWGSFEHRAEVIDADPELPVAPGATTVPTRVVWSEDEEVLAVIDLDGEPEVLRALYAVETRFAIDPEDPTHFLDERTPNALRVDWSMELVGTSVQELGLTRWEPVASFVRDDEDWDRFLPAFVRDPETDELLTISVAAQYGVETDGAFHLLTLRHVFDRIDD